MAQGNASKHDRLAGLTLPKKIKTYPTLNTAFNRHSAPLGRVFYLMRGTDQASYEGRGWLEMKRLRYLFTTGGSPWYLFGWRRFRQILSKGERTGLWQRDGKKHIRLYSLDRIALAINCGRLRGRPVYIPSYALLGGIKLVRAHFYASFESGLPAPRPLSRKSLEQITGIPPRTQQAYDKLLDRHSQINVAVTDIPFIPENIQEFAWQHGHNLLRFEDKKGLRDGSPGAKYIAYQLPSTRETIHEQAPRGRQDKYNASINLVRKTERGNVAGYAYHDSPEEAAAAFNRDPDLWHHYPNGSDVIPDPDEPTRLQAVQIWEVVSR